MDGLKHRKKNRNKGLGEEIAYEKNHTKMKYIYNKFKFKISVIFAIRVINFYIHSRVF